MASNTPGPRHYNYAIVFRQHTDAPKEYKKRRRALIETIVASIVGGALEALTLTHRPATPQVRSKRAYRDIKWRMGV